MWAAKRYVMSIFNLSNSEISYQSIKNLDNEDEEDIDPMEERDVMGEEPDELEEKKKLIVDEVHRKRLMM